MILIVFVYYIEFIINNIYIYIFIYQGFFKTPYKYKRKINKYFLVSFQPLFVFKPLYVSVTQHKYTSRCYKIVYLNICN